MGRWLLHRWPAFLLGCLMFVSLSAPAQEDESLSRVNLPGESTGLARRLAAADKLAAAEQWAEAVAEYQRILNEAGDELAPVSSRLSVSARRLCHQRLSALPPAALRIYREKVDAQARKWLEQGEAERDARPLRRIVNEAFCSRSGGRALDLLGDLAFERGDFFEAEQWWRMIVREAEKGRRGEGEKGRRGEGDNLVLVFPDPQVDVARVRAKQLLARLYSGERDRPEDSWSEALKAYREVHGKAEGSLAGRKGRYADILKELAETPALVPDEKNWPTFAGGFSRNYRLSRTPARIDRRSPLDPPTWTWRLDGAAIRPKEGEKVDKVVPPAAQARSLAVFPVVWGDHVLTADARYVRAFNLRTGEQAIWYDLMTDGGHGDLDLSLKLPAEPDLRYTLTVAEGRVYARMGAQVLGPPKDEAKKGARDSFLVCLNPKSDGRGRERWHVKANLTDRATEMFEGAPVVSAGRVYVAVSRWDGSVTTAVACYDADTGAPRWRKAVDVCEIVEHPQRERRLRHHLLTLAGSRLIYGSHSGALVALDAETGRRLWAMRYPSRGDKTAEGQPSPRDLTPCLYASGRIFAAPADYGRILCLDPDTGRTLWESDPPVEVVHLLGVAHGRLIFTTPTDIRALAIDTGKTVRESICPPDGVQLPSYGRGLLAGRSILWPTVKGLRVLDVESGQPDERVAFNYLPNDLRGNLTATPECLIVADTEKLAVYAAPRLLLEPRRREADANPASPSARYALALAETDAGLYERARKNFAWIEQAATPNDRWNGEPLSQLARQGRHAALLDQAQEAQAARQWDKAAELLKRAEAEEFPLADRLEAFRREAEMWADAGRSAEALAAWQSVLRETQSKGRKTQSAEAEKKIEELLREQGAALYEPMEREAKKRFASAQGERRAETLERLVQEFPHAAVTGSALLQLAELHEKAGRHGAAAHAYRRFLQRNGESSDRLKALAGLAQAYEKEHCWDAARAAWQRLVRELADAPPAELDPARPMREAAMERLRKLTSEGPRELLPLTRAWHIEPSLRLLVPDDPQSAGETEHLFFASGQGQKVTLYCHDAVTGKRLWEQALFFSPSWIGRHADTVLLADAERVQARNVSDGSLLWSFVLGPWSLANAHPTLHAPRLTPHALFFLEEGRRLWALDAETGRVLWKRWAPGAAVDPLEPGGRFYPYFHAGKRWVTLQTSHGKLWVLDARTGRTLHERETARDPWPRPPLPLDERRLCLVTDFTRIVLFDPEPGKELWEQKLPRPSISGTAPQVVSDGKTLLLLRDGWELRRVDPQTGETLWLRGEPRWLSKQPAEPWHAALDAHAVYFVRLNVLYARSLDDGKPLWDRPLPGPASSWRTLLARNSLIVYPLPDEPLPPRLQIGLPLDAPPPALKTDFSILLCDPKDGQVLQRLNFEGNAVATVQRLKDGLAVSVGGEVWGIRAKE